MAMTYEQIAEWFNRFDWPVTPDFRVQVSAYAVNRCFGGHEEGGWWYDAYHFAGISERVSIEEIDAAKERIKAMFADEQPRFPISSMANDGPEYWPIVELKVGDSETKERPHYS
jgi:hypothetical protein